MFNFNFCKIRGKFRKKANKNFAKILQNYENKNFAANLFNVVQQCYFEIKTNTEPYFSILSSTIQWSTTTPVLNLALTQLVNPISYRYACFVAFWFKEIKNNLVTKQAVLVDGPKKLLSYQRRH